MEQKNKLLFDKSFRDKLRNNPKKEITGLDYKNNDIDYKVVTNTKHTTYIVFNDQSLNIKLNNIQAGTQTVSTAGSGGTAGSLSTYGCIGCFLGSAGSFSTAGCVSSLGTVGSAGTVEV